MTAVCEAVVNIAFAVGMVAGALIAVVILIKLIKGVIEDW